MRITKIEIVHKMFSNLANPMGKRFQMEIYKLFTFQFISLNRILGVLLIIIIFMNIRDDNNNNEL